ncbi:MAG: DnaJ domain-containing protein, partial [Candidatus Nitrosopelagicus sp.]|nr:DnaJ domain-containing protein [Candidatus Nitrosopelagicus sp.]
MLKPYLIEIRLMGETKDLTKKLIYDIFHKFKVRGQIRKKPVPHVTLFGPFGCKSIREVIHAIGEVGSEYKELEYGIDGFDFFELKKKFLFITTSTKKNVIYLKIKPSEDLKDFRHELAKRLLKFTDAVNASHDSRDKFQFHATIAMKDIHHKFDEIWEYLKSYDIKTKGMCYRITLLNQGKIMYEYELPTKRLLNRQQALRRRPRESSDEDRTRQSSQKTRERSTSSLKECYEILEVSDGSTTNDIRASYRRLSLLWHPDKHRDSTRKKIAEEQMKLINNAKTTL